MKQSFKLEQFDYTLPAELIAQHPLPERSASRLLVVDRGHGQISHGTFADLGRYFPPGTVLAINNTKVIPARLRAKKPSGGKLEILLVRKLDEHTWETMIQGKVRVGASFRIGENLSGQVTNRTETGRWCVQFEYAGDFSDLLDTYGRMPLPPYIKRPDGCGNTDDRQRYQTVYASQAGAIAAPTAGLHFTPQVMDTLGHAGVSLAPLTLHIGPATFLPVKEDVLSQHHMEPEYFEIPEKSARLINSAADRLVAAVGTSSLRALESACDQSGHVVPGCGQTTLFITPGYRFKSRLALLTNLHLPCSTNLMLVAALAGYELTMQAYREAVTGQYRFYSYGDAMLII